MLRVRVASAATVVAIVGMSGVLGCVPAAGSRAAPVHSAPRSPTIPGAVVPPQYAGTYATLSADIANLKDQEEAGSVVGPPDRTVMAGVLDGADGNRGPALLQPGSLSQVVATLGQFHAMGMRGVMIEIGFPMLLPTFPDSAGYLAFYKQVGAAVGSWGMQLSIELNPVFTDPQISSLHPDYTGLTLTTYAMEQAQEAQIIIDNLHPTYLTVLDEPSTFAYNLGLPIDTPAHVVQLLDIELASISRGSTEIGAGIGTWEDPAIDQAIVDRTSVDYLSVHVYPTGPTQIATLNDVTRIASEAHRPLVMDETWLSKSDPTTAPGVGNPVIEGRIKNWSFWEPLDAQYLSVITAYARGHGFAFVAPFATGLFFGYLTWSPALEAMTKGQVDARAALLQTASCDAGRLSPVGAAFEGLIENPRPGRPGS